MTQHHGPLEPSGGELGGWAPITGGPSVLRSVTVWELRVENGHRTVAAAAFLKKL